MKFIKQVSMPVSLTSLMLEGMHEYDKHRGVEFVHASDLSKETGFCPREFALHDIAQKPVKGFHISAALRHTFDMGRDIESRVQNDYMRSYAVGDWECTSCGNVRTFCKAPVTGCDREDIRCNWRYKEVRLIIPPLTAGMDLFVDVGRPKLRMIELKSVIKDDFAKLEAPLAEHRLRTNIYMRMMKESPMEHEVDTNIAHVLYVAKSYGKWDGDLKKFSPFKEYIVKYDKELTDELWDRAMEYGVYKDTGKVPSGICPHGATKRAKACVMRSECWHVKNK